MKRILLPLVILMLVVAAVFPACSSSTADNTTAYCNSLQNLVNAEAQVRSINASTTVDQAKQYYQNLQNAWSATITAKGNLANSKIDDLQNAYNQLKSALDGLSGSQTIAEALPAIQSAVTTFDASLQEVQTTVCHFTPTSTP